ncbi:MAG: hypothetical protein WDN45_15270 [Caulobacteraceae bacterium]
MIVRCLPALLISAALGLVLAPSGAAAQMTMGPGVRTEMTPSAREAHNGVFDHVKRGLGLGARKASVTVGDVPARHPADAGGRGRRLQTSGPALFHRSAARRPRAPAHGGAQGSGRLAFLRAGAWRLGRGVPGA